MADKVFEGRIEAPRKTHAIWTSQNPILRYGERVTVIMEDGSIRHKTGDGVVAYSALPFDEADIDAAIARLESASGGGAYGAIAFADDGAGNVTVMVGGVELSLVDDGAGNVTMEVS